MPDGGDEERLSHYVEVWWDAVARLCDLLEQVPADAWHRPTDLPGWDVHAVVAHTAHLERVLATGVEEEHDVGEVPHARGPMGHYTEIGVVRRRGASPADLVAEIREVTAQRHEALLADPPTDAGATPEVTFGGMPWTWEHLLANRPLDVWMHEQDVRRAADLPGGTDAPAAHHTVDRLLAGQSFVLGKRVGAPAGTSVRWEVAGHDPLVVEVGEDGRAARVDPHSVDAPTLTLACDREAFALLAGGRRTPEDVAVTVTGDEDLAARYLASMVTVP